jgi:hypothetical protein
MTKKHFAYDFEEDTANRISFDYSPEADEKLDTLVENGVPILYLNRPGMITLAKVLIKMAMGPYDDGFHVHLSKDLNADLPNRLTVMLHQSQGSGSDPAAGRAEIKRSTTILPPR